MRTNFVRHFVARSTARANMVFMGGSMTKDERLNLMLELKRETGVSLDVLDQLPDGLSRQAFLMAAGRLPSSPSYIQSSDRS